MLEQYAFYVLAAAVALGLIGFFWLVVRAFQVRKLWGFGVLLIFPLGILFLMRHGRRAIGPMVVLILAGLTAAAPFGLSYYERHYVPLQPFEQRVDGEMRLTLTGLKDFDYSTLQGRTDIIVLQMGNPDVDDHTLSYLTGMNRLRTLDVNDSKITDEGLAVIAGLPALQELRLARTPITDEGFQKHLAGKQSLLKLNLTGTDVKGKTKRDWKKARPEERDYVD
jgi:hypothetical protein